MSSRASIQQIVSTSAPVGAALGDEWLNPTTGILYKRTLIRGVVDWLSLSSGYSGSVGAAGPAGPAGGAGNVGFTGSQGIDGAFAGRGYSGSQGPSGNSGVDGNIGYVGSASTVPGYTGSRGLDGAGGITTVTNYTAVTNIVGTTSTYTLIPGYINKDYTGAINDTYTTTNGDLYAWKGNTLGWVLVGNIKGATYTLVAQVYTPGSLFTGYNSLYTAKWFPSRSISILGITARVLSPGTQPVSLNINVDDVTVSTISFSGYGPAAATNTPISIASTTSNVTVIVTNTGAYASDLYVSINYVNVF